MGVCRLGYSAFFISPRNSAQAVTQLLVKTGAAHLLVGPEKPSADLAAAALEAMEIAGLTPPALSSMPLFDTLYPAALEPGFELLPPVKYDMDAPAVLTHTSGCLLSSYISLLKINITSQVLLHIQNRSFSVNIAF